MKLTCDACDASFNVPDSAIKPEGRKVKCSKCGHVWVAMPAAEPEPAEEAPNSSEQTELSSQEDEALQAIAQMLSEEETAVKKKTRKPSSNSPYDRLVKRLIVVCFFGIVLASIFAFKNTLMPVLKPVYDMFGMTTSEQVVIRDLSYKQIPDDKKDRFTVSGKIVNTGDSAAPIPTLRISLLDEEREAFYSRDYEEDKMLEPAEEYPFNVGRIETAFKGKAAFVIVEVGNSYELNAR